MLEKIWQSITAIFRPKTTLSPSTPVVVSLPPTPPISKKSQPESGGENGEYFVWERSVFNYRLSVFFDTKSFTCNCGKCVEQKVSKDLIARLGKLAMSYGRPVYILSGYRCAMHQQELRDRGLLTAVSVSQHELGRAADVHANDMQSVTALAPEYFKAIGVAKTFIHVDLRDDKVRRWTY